MQRTRVKICGVMRVEDALAAARAGADAIGMVFYKPAPRCITHDRAREILAALPPFVTPVGLFVDAPADEVRAVASSLGVRHVQLHGREDPVCIAALREFIVIKAVRVARETFRQELAIWRTSIASHALRNLHGLVLETAAGAPGGTGLANDWDLVRACQSEGLFAGLPPMIAAGGLTPRNVAAVVREVRPWAVDVSSGVEISKGTKSAEMIDAFVREVIAADRI